MPGGRTPETAGRLFLEALGSVTSCVTRQRLDISSYDYVPNTLTTTTFPVPVSLRSSAGGPSGLFLDVARGFAIVEVDRARFRRRWRATTRMYEYRLLDYDHTELLVYHWQPGSEFAGPDHPHVHVSATLLAQADATTQRPIDLDKRHLATGDVSIETVVRMLIDEFDIAPLRHDWRQMLDRVTATLRDESL